ncbi:MAG: alkaline phosphatase family protein [Actinomycetota bacterium]|nr:alkaline phosphatase family protein [Actinomycetota bacterium]
MPIRAHRRGLFVATAALAATACLVAVNTATSAAHPLDPAASADHSGQTSTPIKHVVVIYDENVSFDHYFATYPKAANTDGTTFVAAKHTPKANTVASAGLLKKNPNLYNPTRLSRAQALTCDQNHNYGPEQKATDGGKNDLFVQNTSVDTCSGLYQTPGLTMGYYDGNTVTGLWNYAQQFALSDNSFSSVYGPSTPGALNLVSGQTHGAQAVNSVTGAATTDSYAVVSPDANGVGTVINDPDPYYDDCADKDHTSTNNLAKLSGQNIGDLLNARNVTWGWFQGGFKPTTPYAGTGTYAKCDAAHTNIGNTSVVDYSPHHSPFEYYASTSNPHHLPPTSVWAIGRTDQANHNYDLTDFNAALTAGVLPSVSFLKAPEYQDGHAAYSDPIDEQHFLVSEINAIQQSQFWKDTAIVVAYDDSDGWYDHQSSKVLNGSTNTAQDSAACVSGAAKKGIAGGYLDRCGPGTRQPLLVISPYSKTNFVDHTATEQASITKFIEDNWQTGRIGDASFDKRAGTLDNLFDFRRPNDKQVLLKADGAVASVKHICTHSGWFWHGCR